MAKRKKIIPKSNARQPKGTQAGKDSTRVDLQEEVDDAGSDCGRFEEDDTEDAIPSEWRSANKPEGIDNEQRTEAVELKETTLTFSNSRRSEGSTNHVHSSLVSKVTNTITSKIINPEPKVYEKRTPLEGAQYLCAALRSELDKKELSLKSAKKQAGDARAEASTVRSKHADELEKIRKELNAQHCLEFNEVKEERDRATTDLRKLRKIHEKMKLEHVELQNQLQKEKAVAQNLHAKNEQLLTKSTTLALASETHKHEATESIKQVQNLASLLTNETKKKQTLEQKVSTLEAELRMVRAQNGQPGQQASYAMGLATLANQVMNYNALSKSHTELKIEHENVKREFKGHKDGSQQLQQKADLARKSSEIMKKELESERRKNADQAKLIKNLRDNIVALEKERDVQDPILKKGAAIGLRFLEHARETVLEIPRSQVDRAIILNGNNAAHQANGMFHAALFKAGFVSDEYEAAATEAFEALYDIGPYEFEDYSRKIRRVANCQATIRALKSINNGDRSIELRAARDEVESEILRRQDEYDFEFSWKIEDLITQFESLTEEVVEIDRSRYGRRR